MVLTEFVFYIVLLVSPRSTKKHVEESICFIYIAKIYFSFVPQTSRVRTCLGEQNTLILPCVFPSQFSNFQAMNVPPYYIKLAPQPPCHIHNDRDGEYGTYGSLH